MNTASILNRTLAAATLLLAAAGACAQNRAPEEPGMLLRSGNWGGDVGTFAVPPALQALPPAQWPAAGWHRIDWDAHGLHSTPVAAPAEGQPPFLRSIVAQVQAAAQGDADKPGTITETVQDDPLPMYLRVPGSRLRQGFVPAYRFRNGTRELRPQVEHRYELLWQGQPFAFAVQNGLRTPAGVAYGEGTVVTIEIEGDSHRYHLPGFAWDTVVHAIADIDADGKPDFVISVGGTEAVLLSSQAKPGQTRPQAPTATLTAYGC
jgi:hypothetical protein